MVMLPMRIGELIASCPSDVTPRALGARGAFRYASDYSPVTGSAPLDPFPVLGQALRRNRSDRHAPTHLRVATEALEKG
jgi:hypothetical protein